MAGRTHAMEPQTLKERYKHPLGKVVLRSRIQKRRERLALHDLFLRQRALWLKRGRCRPTPDIPEMTTSCCVEVRHERMTLQCCIQCVKRWLDREALLLKVERVE